MITVALVLPSPTALLPPDSRVDPVAELRAACERAIRGLTAEPVERLVVVAPEVGAANRGRGIEVPRGLRVARRLLESSGVQGLPELEELTAGPDVMQRLGEDARPTALLVMADGSACRGEKAPGHLHPDAVPFDDELDAALRHGDADALLALDAERAAAVWCDSVPALRVLGEAARGREVAARVDHDEAPYGVAWWVARWDLR